jgi:hypothetical protein
MGFSGDALSAPMGYYSFWSEKILILKMEEVSCSNRCSILLNVDKQKDIGAAYCY